MTGMINYLQNGRDKVKNSKSEREECYPGGCEMVDVNGGLVRAVGPWHFRLQFREGRYCDLFGHLILYGGVGTST